MANIIKADILGQNEDSSENVAVAVLMRCQKNLTASSPCTVQREGVMDGSQMAVIRTRTVSRLLVNFENHDWQDHVQE